MTIEHDRFDQDGQPVRCPGTLPSGKACLMRLWDALEDGSLLIRIHNGLEIRATVGALPCFTYRCPRCRTRWWAIHPLYPSRVVKAAA